MGEGSSQPLPSEDSLSSFLWSVKDKSQCWSPEKFKWKVSIFSAISDTIWNWVVGTGASKDLFQIYHRLSWNIYHMIKWISLSYFPPYFKQVWNLETSNLLSEGHWCSNCHIIDFIVSSEAFWELLKILNTLESNRILHMCALM